MNILSLFDGISCGQQALKELGIEVDKYFASEIKEDAIKVTMENHPGTIQIGDVTKIKSEELPRIDLLIGGSPCQDLSIAMKNREGLKGSKSSLFFEYLRLLKEVKPKYFLLENVGRMSKEDKDIITELIGVEPIRINSKLVSAQLRDRLYWTNILGVQQPEDKGILLKDILEHGFTDREKSRAILESESRPLRDKERMYRKYSKTGFTTIVYNVPPKVKVRRYKVDVEKLKEILREHRRPIKEIVEHFELKKTTVEHWFRKDDCFSVPGEDIWFKLKEFLGITTYEFDKSIMEFDIRDGVFETSQRVYDLNGKGCCLTKTGASTQRIWDTQDIRYFTKTELERLQTLPDGYTKVLTRDKAAGCIGDGWTVEVIKHIFKNLPCTNENIEKDRVTLLNTSNTEKDK